MLVTLTFLIATLHSILAVSNEEFNNLRQEVWCMKIGMFILIATVFLIAFVSVTILLKVLCINGPKKAKKPAPKKRPESKHNNNIYYNEKELEMKEFDKNGKMPLGKIAEDKAKENIYETLDEKLATQNPYEQINSQENKIYNETKVEEEDDTYEEIGFHLNNDTYESSPLKNGVIDLNINNDGYDDMSNLKKLSAK